MDTEMSSNTNDGETSAVSMTKLRTLRAQLSVLHRADGSVALQQGGTVVWAAVYGPGDSTASKRLNDRAFIDVLFKPKVSRPANDIGATKENVSPLLRGTCESMVDIRRHPRTLIELVVQELTDDGGLRAVCLTAGCLALLDAGIPMTAVFCGVSVALMPDDRLVLDPPLKEQKMATALFTFALKSAESEVEMISCDTNGRFQFDDFKRAVSLAIEAAAEVFLFYREMMQRKLSLG
uniref:Exosome component 5 n=1 Tax=Plectus sambesii TaxID=2011161 RepID=A0A914W9J4_9BILA